MGVCFPLTSVYAIHARYPSFLVGPAQESSVAGLIELLQGQTAKRPEVLPGSPGWGAWRPHHFLSPHFLSLTPKAAAQGNMRQYYRRGVGQEIELQRWRKMGR